MQTASFALSSFILLPCVSFLSPRFDAVRAAINDDNWLNAKFIEDVQDRGAVIIKVRGVMREVLRSCLCVKYSPLVVCGLIVLAVFCTS